MARPEKPAPIMMTSLKEVCDSDNVIVKMNKEQKLSQRVMFFPMMRTRHPVISGAKSIEISEQLKDP